MCGGEMIYFRGDFLYLTSVCGCARSLPVLSLPPTHTRGSSGDAPYDVCVFTTQKEKKTHLLLLLLTEEKTILSELLSVCLKGLVPRGPLSPEAALLGPKGGEDSKGGSEKRHKTVTLSLTALPGLGILLIWQHIRRLWEEISWKSQTFTALPTGCANSNSLVNSTSAYSATISRLGDYFTRCQCVGKRHSSGHFLCHMIATIRLH